MATTINPTSGDIDAKSVPSNLLTYAITTDGAMSTITEKVNGVTVGTRTATSGQSLTVSLSDTQWDAVEYGKYAGGKNILPPFDNWTGVNANAKILSQYQLQLTPTNTSQSSWVNVYVRPEETYTFSLSHNGFFAIDEFKKDKTWSNIVNLSTLQKFTFTTTNKAETIRIYLNNGSNTSGIFTFANPQLELGSNQTSFESNFEPNTLTIEMGTEKWEYTFTKTVNTNTTETQLVEAVKDMSEVVLPGVKEKLAVAVRSKGGTVPSNPSFDGLVEAIVGIEVGKKYATGTLTTASNGTFAVTGIPFTPKLVVLKSLGTSAYRFGFYKNDSSLMNIYVISVSNTRSESLTFTNNGFSYNLTSIYESNTQYTWEIYGG